MNQAFALVPAAHEQKPDNPPALPAPDTEPPRITATKAPDHTRVKIELTDAMAMKIGGSASRAFNEGLLLGTLACAAFAGDADAIEAKHTAVCAALAAFKPRDEIEGMLAAQATALHYASMECMRRAMLPQQPAEMASKLRKDGADLARSMTDMREALDRKRGKGPQVVRVERVVVHEGGRAIVGAVAAGIRPVDTGVAG